MSYPFSRNVRLTAISAAALCFACGAEPNRTSNTAEAPPMAPSPEGSSPPPTTDKTPTPSSEPSTAPPSGPESRSTTPLGNEVATPKPSSLPPAQPRLSESQVAMVTELANSSEIEQGKLAQSKAKSPAVKKFAAMMIKHHTEAKNDQAKLYKELKLTPTQSQQATALKEDADKTLGSLRAADGAAFDMTYINGQVDAHQKVLDSINQELLPAANDQKLVDGLNKMKATVESHLDEARSIQSELIKNSSGAEHTSSH